MMPHLIFHPLRRGGIGTGLAGAFAAFFMLSAFAVAGSREPALVPWPSEISVGRGVLVVDGPFVVTWTGHRDARMESAVERFAADLRRRTGSHPRNPGPELEINVASRGPVFPRPKAREAYSLSVDEGGVRLSAERPAGAMRGLATLRQLVAPGKGGFEIPRVSVEDSPRFSWRGLMIDTARHFVTIPTLKRQIDAMERVKLNVLHLHLSNTEGFRVQSRRFPRLTGRYGGGDYHTDGNHYTQDEIRDLVAYAAERGVRVVPEIDLPAHTGAMLAAYPELSARAVKTDSRVAMMGLAMDPTRPGTYDFIAELLAEMAALFPDPYFHVGGDEVPENVWTSNPDIRAFMDARGYRDQSALQRHFFRRVRKILSDLDKTAIGWEEVAAGPLDDSVVVQAWRSSEALTYITGQNNRAILSAGYYLDLLWPGLDHYRRDPIDPQATPPLTPGDALGPAPGGPLTARQAGLVMGAEAALWSEVVSDEMVDGRLWPRAAMLAERFWSPAAVRDEADIRRRIVPVLETMRIGGLADAANRHRMAARLAPADAEALETLAAATAPVRNFGRLAQVIADARAGKPLNPPALITPADIAAPDSIAMHRLASRVEDFLRDGSGSDALSAELARYRDNHPRFVAVAPGVASLEAAIPVSADVAAVAQAGLDAVEMIERGARPSQLWSERVEALMRRQAQAEAASASNLVVLGGAEQPPTNLLVALAPVVEPLLEAAGRGGEDR